MKNYNYIKEYISNEKVVLLNPNLPSWVSLTLEGYEIYKYIKNNRADMLLKQNNFGLTNSEIVEFEKYIETVLFSSNQSETNSNEEINVATVFLTSACNFQCKHCFYSCSNNKGENLDFENQFLPFLDDFTRHNGKFITFTGGEPLIVQNLEKYFNACKERGIKFALLTNGSLITHDLCELFKKYNAVLQVSLDGDNETFGLIRKGGQFNKVIEGIKQLSNYGIPYDISFMPSKVNINSFDNILNIAIENKATSIHMPLLEQYGTAKDNTDLLYLSEDELIGFFDRLIDRYFNGLQDKIKINFIESIISDLHNSRKKICCNIGRNYGSIYSDGSLFPCSEVIQDNFKIGKFADNHFHNTQNDVQFFSNLNVDDFEKCNECEFKYYCGGGCRLHSYIKYNSFYKEDTYCELLKHCYERILLYIG